MLVLTRRLGQKILIGDNVEVVLLEVRGNQVRLGIVAPTSVRVNRAEVIARRHENCRKEQGAEALYASAGAGEG